jgi:alcohol dehydrogenase class IV
VALAGGSFLQSHAKVGLSFDSIPTFDLNNVQITSKMGLGSHVTSRHVTSRHVTSRHVTSRHVTSRHVTSRHILCDPEFTQNHLMKNSPDIDEIQEPFLGANIAPL